MTYTRWGDEAYDDARWDDVPYEARWHYAVMVAECSRSQRFECVLPMKSALRCSDVDDPLACIEALRVAGFVTVSGDEVTIVDGERRHMLPPSKRSEHAREGQRRRTAKSRRAKCERGEHSPHCPADTCPARAGNALPQDRTGQDRTHQQNNAGSEERGDHGERAQFFKPKGGAVADG